MNPVFELIKRKKAFIWDFDGCFADTEPLHRRAYAGAFAAFEHFISLENYYDSFTHKGGGPDREIHEHGLKCSLKDILSIKNMIYKKLIAIENGLVFGEITGILKCQLSLGAQIAIASNSPLENILPILEKSDSGRYVEEIVGYTKELKKKPAPDLFIRALEKLNVQPAEALVFEDSERGLQAAAAAGIDAIWVKTKLNDHLDMKAPHIADFDHKDLKKLFQNLLN